MRIGKPCHFRPTNLNVSACGVVTPEYWAYDGRDVDCLRCQRTDKWLRHMGKGKHRKGASRCGKS